jgi:hypothetical protein
VFACADADATADDSSTPTTTKLTRAERNPVRC